MLRAFSKIRHSLKFTQSPFIGRPFHSPRATFFSPPKPSLPLHLYQELVKTGTEHGFTGWLTVCRSHNDPFLKRIPDFPTNCCILHGRKPGIDLDARNIVLDEVDDEGVSIDADTAVAMGMGQTSEEALRDAAGKIIKALGRKENRNGAISSTRVGSESLSVPSLPSGIYKRLLDLGEESGFNALQMKFQGPEESSVYAPATGFEACVMFSTKWVVNEEKCTVRQLESQPLGMGFGDDKREALFEAAKNVIKRLEEEVEFEKLSEENEQLKKCLQESQK